MKSCFAKRCIPVDRKLAAQLSLCREPGEGEEELIFAGDAGRR